MIQLKMWPLVALLLSATASATFGQEREWSWDETDTDAFLVFGTPNTDDVGVSFWCKLGSSRIKLFMPGLHAKATKPEKAAAIVSVSSASHVKIPGTISPNSDAGTHEFEATLPATDPIFAQLEKAEYFQVEIANRKASFPLDSANIDDLVKACKTSKK